MLASEVAYLAGFGPIGVAGSCLTALVWVEMGECAGAVSVFWHRLIMDVVDYRNDRSITHLHARLGRSLYHYGEVLLKGPPSVGRFEKSTWNMTPEPSGMLTAWMDPLALLPSG